MKHQSGHILRLKIFLPGCSSPSSQKKLLLLNQYRKLFVMLNIQPEIYLPDPITQIRQLAGQYDPSWNFIQDPKGLQAAAHGCVKDKSVFGRPSQCIQPSMFLYEEEECRCGCRQIHQQTIETIAKSAITLQSQWLSDNLNQFVDTLKLG